MAKSKTVSGQVNLAGTGSLVLNLPRGLSSFTQAVVTAPGLPPFGSNFQDLDTVSVVVAGKRPAFRVRKVWTATVIWNLSVPKILTYSAS